MKLHLGDSREILASMEPNSVDAICCDPPYEISFMGRKWDGTGIAYDPDFWGLCLRVLKPGGHLTSFGACRTYHRIAVGIENAGFEVRDCLQWIFGTGFPKSLDVSKAIDRAAGAERPRDKLEHGCLNSGTANGWWGDGHSPAAPLAGTHQVGPPITPEAQQWDGWGTALKPAYEPIILARKPLAGTVAANVLEYGTGGVNVDGCRVGETVETWPKSRSYDSDKMAKPHSSEGFSKHETQGAGPAPAGRWPPNILIDQAAAEALGPKAKLFPQFIYEAKASRKEREAGCDALAGKTGAEAVNRKDGSAGKDNPRAGSGRTAKQVKNYHPTVKPISVIRWVLKLITPPGGVVLDPFMGSGTTGCAAALEGFDFIGVEQDPQYMEIAKARIKHWGTDEE